MRDCVFLAKQDSAQEQRWKRVPITEDTVNDLMAQYLRQQDLNILSQQTIPFSGPRKPDFGLRDGGLFYGEGE